MIVEGYTMDAYCDDDSVGRYDHIYAAQYAGRNRRECRTQAVRDGWKLRGKTLCPTCTRKKATGNAQAS